MMASITRFSMLFSVLRGRQPNRMQATRRRPAQPDDAVPAIYAAQAFRSLERQRLSVAKPAFRGRIELRPRQSFKQAAQCKQPAEPLLFVQLFQGTQGHGVLALKIARCGATQRGQMTHGAERRGHVLRKRADVGALAAADAQLEQRGAESD